MKRLLRTLSRDLTTTARLRSEGQVIARLDDPRMVRLYDLITDGADVVLVMEHVRGPRVQSLAAAWRPSPSQVLAVVGDVAAALDYAAGRGVVHRDVKPANVFVDRRGTVQAGRPRACSHCGRASHVHVERRDDPRDSALHGPTRPTRAEKVGRT